MSDTSRGRAGYPPGEAEAAPPRRCYGLCGHHVGGNVDMRRAVNDRHNLGGVAPLCVRVDMVVRVVRRFRRELGLFVRLHAATSATAIRSSGPPTTIRRLLRDIGQTPASAGPTRRAAAIT